MKPVITFIDHLGNRQEISANIGDSVMLSAVQNGVTGIDAECGGGCSCATCHVYVDKNWLEKIAQPSSIEQDMLGIVEAPAINSRLACQIKISESLDGLVITTPVNQGSNQG